MCLLAIQARGACESVEEAAWSADQGLEGGWADTLPVPPPCPPSIQPETHGRGMGAATRLLLFLLLLPDEVRPPCVAHGLRSQAAWL